MTLIWSLLIFVNYLLVGYLIFLFYRKNPVRVKTGDANTDKITKIKMIRFNPFDDLGGDQSFIICFLDSTDSGVIITSLHGREQTRIYAKPIVNGRATEAMLSSDEKNLLSKTINN